MKLRIVFAILLLLLTGCAKEQSSAMFRVADLKSGVIDPNACTAFKGEAATIVSRQIADNMRTKQAMTGDIFKKSGTLFFWLVLGTVGGIAFWGFTRSKFGWVIPTACVGGIALILFFVNYSDIIFTVVMVVSGALLVWKAYEYQSERNAAEAKATELRQGAIIKL